VPSVIPSSALSWLPTLVASAVGAMASQSEALSTHLLLQLHTNGVGFLEEDGVAPEQVTEGGELVPFPLPKGPEGQLELPLRPLHCGDTEGLSPCCQVGGHQRRGAQWTCGPLFLLPQRASKLCSGIQTSPSSSGSSSSSFASG